jgi:hypothetical protein
VYLYHDTPHSHITRRARLLAGRAFTQHTRHRFLKAGEPPVLPHCTFPQCAAAAPQQAAPLETVGHMLLDCLRYATARQQLMTHLSSIAISTPLSLSTILCASMPPLPFHRSSLSALLRHTNTFLDAVNAARAGDPALLPFDPG